jgi:hypothetical protein
MTPDSLDRIRYYVQQTRTEFLIAADNSRRNGYKTIAAQEENKAQLAKLILDDLEKEAHAV